MTTRIAIDVDGVLANFIEAFAQVINSIEPGRVPEGYRPTDWDWSNVLDQEITDKAWDVIDQTENFWLYLGHDIKNVMDLRRFLDTYTNVDVYYVTSRKHTAGATVTSQTHAWLHQHLLIRPNTNVIVVPEFRPGQRRQTTKGEIYEVLGISHSIDDYHKNIRSALRYAPGHKPYLLTRSWNVSDHDLDHVRLSDLMAYLSLVVSDLERSSKNGHI